MIRHRSAVAVNLFTVSGTTIAGHYDDKAEGHFRATATGNLERLAGKYSADTTLQWVSGPLDGVCSDKDKLNVVWQIDSNLSSGDRSAHRQWLWPQSVLFACVATRSTIAAN